MYYAFWCGRMYKDPKKHQYPFIKEDALNSVRGSGIL